MCGAVRPNQRGNSRGRSSWGDGKEPALRPLPCGAVRGAGNHGAGNHGPEGDAGKQAKRGRRRPRASESRSHGARKAPQIWD